MKIDASKVNVEGFGGTSAYNLIGSATAPTIGSNYDSEESKGRKIWRLFGDIGSPADAGVYANDFNAFRTQFGGSSGDGTVIYYLVFNCGADFNGDGAIGTNDFNQFRTRFGGFV